MADLRIALISVTWIFTGIAVLCIGARFFARVTVLRLVGLDDWLMLIAGILQVFFNTGITVAYEQGFGKDAPELSFPQLVEIARWNWIGVPPGVLVSIIARISITILLVKIFGKKVWLKQYLIWFTLLQSILGIAFIIVCFMQVRPVEGLWNPMIEAERWDPSIQQNLAYSVQALFTFSDLTYVLFPVIVIWDLNMATRKKVGLCLMMSLSLFTMAASILKLVTAQSNGGTIRAAANAILWASLEQSLVIIMGCIPCLKPIAKLEMPFFSEVVSTVSSLINSVVGRSRSIISHHSSDRTYQDVELDNSSRKSGHSVLLAEEGGVSAKKSSSRVDLTQPVDQKGIHRTDSYRVTYTAAGTRTG